MPSNWKENLAIDRDLPWWKMILTLNVDDMQVNKDVFLEQLNYKTAAQAGTGPAFLPDGAILYGGNVTTGLASSTFSSSYPQAAFSAMYPTSTFKVASLFNGTSSASSSTLEANTATGPVYYLTNTNKGGAQDYMIDIHRPVIDGWGFGFSYAHTHATQVDPSPSSVASSGYSDNYNVNPNDNIPYRSQYATPDSFRADVTKQFKFFHMKHSETEISLQYIVQTGQAYSYVFKGDGDGRGIGDTSLMYVPTGPSDPNVEWANPTDEANFFAWLAEPTNHKLAAYAGQITPRNEFYAPWQRTLNVHVEQNVPIWGDSYVTLFADCYDFGNLLDKNWGVVDDWDPSFESRTVVGTSFDPSGNGGKGAYVYAFNNGTVTNPTIFSDMSRWAIQVGAKLKF
jgi:hypothetical protein